MDQTPQKKYERFDSAVQQNFAVQQSLDRLYMQRALSLAGQAQAQGEIPVGAVVVRGDATVGEGWNQPITASDPTAHAEILALRQAALRLGNYRLGGTTLYVTLEPCAMCAGAIVIARVQRLVFAARDLRFGAVRSNFCLADSDLLNHQVQVCEGLLAADAAELLSSFFDKRR
jgi:tRNA(adenine34) deaminase